MKTIAATTEHKIGKVTYVVCSSSSEHATDTIDKKINKLIVKDIGQNAEISDNRNKYND